MLENELPLVSIIMPVYNSEKFLQRAIDSVISQTYSNYELIVVDDGSIDNSKTIILNYKENLKYIYQQNAGASAARNTGITNSNGELIAFLDADDLWYPEKLRVQVNAYLNEPNVALIYTAVDKQENFNGLIKIHKKDTIPNIKSFLEIFNKPNLKTPSVMIPRKVLDRVGLFDTDLITAEDQDIFLRCSYKQIVLFIPQVLVYCSVFPGSLCDDIRSYDYNLKVIDMFLQRNPEFYFENVTLVNKTKSRIYFEYADELCYRGECLLSIRTASTSIKYKFTNAAFGLIVRSAIKYVYIIFKNIIN